MTTLVTLLKLLPEVVAIVRSFLEFAKNEQDKAVIKEKASEMKAAVNTSRMSKGDTSQIEQLFNSRGK